MSMSGKNPYTPLMSQIIGLFRQNQGPLIFPHQVYNDTNNSHNKPPPRETTVDVIPRNDIVYTQSWGYFVDPEDETRMPTKLPELKRQKAKSRIQHAMIDIPTKHNRSAL